jgi:DNA-binding MarR family transcriptional regulator
MRSRTKAVVEKPRLERMALLKSVLQGYRVRLDEELQPLGITTAQLRMLWTVELNPDVSGAEIARLCSVTPQTGQALLAKMEAHGWIRRRPSAESERVLVAELTASGRRVLLRARETAEHLDKELWAGMDARELAVLDRALGDAVSRLGR